MGLRLLNYVTLLYQDLIKNGEVTDKLLPPVLPMTLYRGEEKWTASLNFKDLVKKPPPGLGRYVPSFKYLMLDEIRLDDKTLEQMENMVANIFRIEKSRSLKACIPPFVSLINWINKAGASQDSLKRAAISWFYKAQKPAKILLEEDDLELFSEEVEPMLSERIEKWSMELRVEGRAEGEARAKVEIFIKLYEKKFGSVSQELRARLISTDTDTVESLIENLMFATNEDEVFKSLN